MAKHPRAFGAMVLCMAVLAVPAAAAKPLGIASGEQGGTNWRMAQDIIDVCGSSAVPMANVASSGSLDNLYKIYTDPRVQYGIVQEDALVYQQGIDAQMMQRIMMVFPFFSTEIHIVVAANSRLRGLADLRGKRVAEGPKDSGTWVTADTLRKITGIDWKGQAMSLQDGLDAVRKGRADAAVLVAGAPLPMLETATGVRLLDLSHPALDAFKYYRKARIRQGAYPFQREVVETYKVQNALVTYAYKYEHQQEIAALTACIARQVETMASQEQRHPKWKDVTPCDINRVAWQVHPAALRSINRVKQCR